MLRAIALCCCVVPTLTSFANAQLIGASFSGNFYSIDPVTGQGTLLLDSNIDFINSMAIDGQGRIWSSGHLPGTPIDTTNLFTFNPATLEITPGPQLNFGGGLLTNFIDAMAFAPDGRLFAVEVNDYLLTVDTTTGVGTLVGQVNIVPGQPIGVQALEFMPDGSLFGWGVDVGAPGLMSINPNTAAPVSLPGPGGNIQALAVDGLGRLIGIRENLFLIDTTTGAFSLLAPGSGFSDIRGVVAVPEPSLALPLAMAAAALGLWRRRRAPRRAG